MEGTVKEQVKEGRQVEMYSHGLRSGRTGLAEKKKDSTKTRLS